MSLHAIIRELSTHPHPNKELRHFADWWETRPSSDIIGLPNDVDIRSYLLERRFAKDGTETLQLRLDAIRELYTHL